MTRFSEALEYLKPYADKKHQQWELDQVTNSRHYTPSQRMAILEDTQLTHRVNSASYFALKVLDKMEREEVSEGVFNAYLSVLLPENPTIDGVDIVLAHNASHAQLIKETEDE